MFAQLLRRGRPATRCEVSWRAHDRHAQLTAHRNRDHVFLERFSQSNGGVEPSGHDVGERRLDQDFDDDVRIARDESRQPGGGDHLGGGSRCGDPDIPRGSAGNPSRILHCARDLLDRGAQTRKQPLARMRGGNAPSAPRQQLDMQPLLEPPDRMAERRRGYAEARGRPREASFLRDDVERPEAASVFPFHC